MLRLQIFLLLHLCRVSQGAISYLHQLFFVVVELLLFGPMFHMLYVFLINVAFIRSYSGEEETANLLLGKFKWGHAFLSLNRYTFSSFILNC